MRLSCSLEPPRLIGRTGRNRTFADWLKARCSAFELQSQNWYLYQDSNLDYPLIWRKRVYKTRVLPLHYRGKIGGGLWPRVLQLPPSNISQRSGSLEQPHLITLVDSDAFGGQGRNWTSYDLACLWVTATPLSGRAPVQWHISYRRNMTKVG